MHNLVESPSRSPFKCQSCLTGSEGSHRSFWVDFGDITGDEGLEPLAGTVYICEVCLTAAAVEAGLASVKQREDMEEEIEELKSALFDARVKADGMEQALNGLLNADFFNADASAKLVDVLESHSKADKQPSE